MDAEVRVQAVRRRPGAEAHARVRACRPRAWRAWAARARSPSPGAAPGRGRSRAPRCAPSTSRRSARSRSRSAPRRARARARWRCAPRAAPRPPAARRRADSAARGTGDSRRWVARGRAREGARARPRDPATAQYGQQEAIVQGLSPAHERRAVRRLDEGRDQARAPGAPARSTMRGCGGISKARSSTRPWRPYGGRRIEELVDADLGAVGVAGHVDEEVTEQLVREPGRWRLAVRRLGERARERDLQLVQASRGAPRRCAAPARSAPRTGP